MKYGGSTFDPALDEERLNEQTIRVYRLMIDEEWRTLSEISSVTASRDIHTGEWRTKSRSKTHDGKELSFFVVKVGG